MGGGTALDMFAWFFVSSIHRQTRTGIGHATYLQLVKDGGHFSRAVDGPKRKHPIYWFQNFKTEFRIFQQFAEQSEVHGGFTELIIAIIQQSESDFKREISRCDFNHVSPQNGLSAMHFAIYWPLALRELINAGANINCQDNYGRRPVHLAVACGQRESVETLIEADCSLFTPEYSNSLIQESLRNGRDFDQTTNLIVDALVNRHTRLVNLALSTLPDTSELKTRLVLGTVWETLAPQISEELTACNQRIPAALELDCDGEGVYDTAELHADIRLTMPLAERLWRGGFLRINEFSPLNGLTPMLQAWYSADFEMVSWFIDKGVSPYSKHRDAPISGLHLYAARLSYPGGYFQHQPEAIDTSPRFITQLMQEPSCCQDSCSCLCSVGGCSPLSTLVKQSCIFLRPNSSFDYQTIKFRSQVWCDKLLYRPEQHAHHVGQLLRALVFERSGFHHSCCRIGPLGHLARWGRSKSEVESQTLPKQSNLELQEELEQKLKECQDRMSKCQCALLWKPVCAVFHEQCKEVGSTTEI
ncbi:hypothetical protein EDB81DRAFT_323063 [Dactylonectria macrodidyma]|uniref:Uncharacterized protein n=1 Tax=Dactylonectria macrodidyma TaxID=307937 RepID=A0A9P9FE54_9HYPO|nr:hypothetical protein EDB81DRAFT_323063 [Dactylonectria macrodidyma]